MTDEEKAATEEKNRKRRIRVCEILSGGLMECAGALRRVRWALDTDLTEDTRLHLDGQISLFATWAEGAHAEAETLAHPAGFALASPGDTEGGSGKGGGW